MTARKLSRREFLQWAGLGAAAVGVGVVLVSDRAAAEALGGVFGQATGHSPAPARENAEIHLAAAPEEVSSALIERFNQEFVPYHVTRTALDPDKLPGALASGQALKAAILPALRTGWLGGQGILADLSGFFAASSAAKAAHLFSVDGYFTSGAQRWGMALAWSPDYLIWANRQLWQQEGVELPSRRLSLKDWRELSNRLGGARSWGFGTDLTIDFAALLGLAQTLEPAVYLAAEGGRRLNLRGREDFVELVSFVLDWKNEGGIPFRRNLDPLKAYIPDCT
jgi:hypothetical protein